ncbi:MAG: hypothetical protein WAQ27_04810 [Candidatus Microsaccharimonas sp.]
MQTEAFASNLPDSPFDQEVISDTNIDVEIDAEFLKDLGFNIETRQQIKAELKERFAGRIFHYGPYSGTVDEMEACPMFEEMLERGVEAAADWLETNDETKKKNTEEDASEDKPDESANLFAQPEDDSESTVEPKLEKTHSEQADASLSKPEATKIKKTKTAEVAKSVEVTEVTVEPPTRLKIETIMPTIVLVAESKQTDEATVEFEAPKVVAAEEPVVEIDTKTEPVLEVETFHIPIIEDEQPKPEPVLFESPVELEIEPIVVARDEQIFEKEQVIEEEELDLEYEGGSEIESKSLFVLPDFNEVYGDEDEPNPEVLTQIPVLPELVEIGESSEASEPSLQPEIIELVIDLVAAHPDIETEAPPEVIYDQAITVLRTIRVLETAVTAAECREALQAIREALASLLTQLGYADTSPIVERLMRQYDIATLKMYIETLAQAVRTAERIKPSTVLKKIRSATEYYRYGAQAVRMVVRVRRLPKLVQLR